MASRLSQAVAKAKIPHRSKLARRALRQVIKDMDQSRRVYHGGAEAVKRAQLVRDREAQAEERRVAVRQAAADGTLDLTGIPLEPPLSPTLPPSDEGIPVVDRAPA